MTLSISGGFAGVKERIDTDPNGATKVVRRGGGDESRTLSGDDHNRLNSALAAVDFGSVPTSTIDKGARDRLIYKLQYDGHTIVTDKSKQLGAVDKVISLLETYLHDKG